MFDRFRGVLRGSQASSIIQEAFQALPLPMLPFDPAAIATRLVAISYQTQPDLFDGRWTAVQRCRNLHDIHKRDVALTTFDLAHVRPIDPGGVSEHFLRPSARLAGSPHSVAQQ